jgi:hypothetical protein
MTRVVTGNLEHLTASTVFSLLGATERSGVFTFDTPEGSQQIRVDRGRVTLPELETCRQLHRVLSSQVGTFQFSEQPVEKLEGDIVSLTGLVEIVRARGERTPFASDLDFDELLSEDPETPPPETKVVMLSEAPIEDPIQDLLTDLESMDPDEVLVSPIGVLANDPRMWRNVEREWRKRGWQQRLLASPNDVALDEIDLLIVQHSLSTTRVGHEDDWVDLIRRASSRAPQVPVLWVGPLGDPIWVHRLVSAGVSFLLPPPAGSTGETASRFLASVQRVADRLLMQRGETPANELPSSLVQLMDALLSDSDPQAAVTAILQVAAVHFTRGALLTVEETAFRCSAGFGFLLAPGAGLLPRGIGLLERVVRSRRPLIGIEETHSGGARQLGKLLGLDTLEGGTSIVPLLDGECVVGLLVGDRCGEDQPAEELDELVLLGQRLGGLVRRP